MILLQETIVEELVKKKYNVIVLAPWPRHFAPCCDDKDHFAEGFNPVEMNELIRDGGTFLCRRLNTIWKETTRRVVAVHPERIYSDKVYRAGSVIFDDHVHIRNDLRFTLTTALVDLAIALVINQSVDDWFDGEANPEGLGLGDWLELYRSQNAAELPVIDITGAKPSAGLRPAKAGHRGNHPKRGGKRGGYHKRFKN